MTLEHLQMFCQANGVVVCCRQGPRQLRVSPFGTQTDPQDEGGRLLREGLHFEVIPLLDDQEIRYFMTRLELEQFLRRLCS